MKAKIILGIVGVALIGGAFYWFQWRPSQIRKECQFVATHPLGFTALLVANEARYQDCLRQHGLEK